MRCLIVFTTKRPNYPAFFFLLNARLVFSKSLSKSLKHILELFKLFYISKSPCKTVLSHSFAFEINNRWNFYIETLKKYLLAVILDSKKIWWLASHMTSRCSCLSRITKSQICNRHHPFLLRFRNQQEMALAS